PVVGSRQANPSWHKLLRRYLAVHGLLQRTSATSSARTPSGRSFSRLSTRKTALAVLRLRPRPSATTPAPSQPWNQRGPTPRTSQEWLVRLHFLHTHTHRPGSNVPGHPGLWTPAGRSGGGPTTGSRATVPICHTTGRRSTRGGRRAGGVHLVPAVRAALPGRRAHGVHRPVGNRRVGRTGRRHLHHARARRSLPAGGDRAAAYPLDPDRGASRCGPGAVRRGHPGGAGRLGRGGRGEVHGRARLQRRRAPAGGPPEGQQLGRLRARA